MASINLPRRRGWGNLQVPCEAPLDRLRPRGEGCPRALPSPCFLRPAQPQAPRNSRFLVRPRLLMRFPVLPMAHQHTGANMVWLSVQDLLRYRAVAVGAKETMVRRTCDGDGRYGQSSAACELPQAGRARP